MRSLAMLRGVGVGLLLLVPPSAVLAGPREDAQAAFDQFFTSFTAANADAVVALFAPDALFYGTSSQEVVTTPEGVRAYFTNAFGTPPRAPGSNTAAQLGEATILMLSDDVAVISGAWQVEVAGAQPTVRGPYRVTVALANRGSGWQIVQFHNSPRPTPPATPVAVVAAIDGLAVWGKGGCSNCHGGVAQGGGGGEDPVGPNLRETALDRDLFAETVACGRPFSEMPYNRIGAYTEHQCYGMPLGPPPGNLDKGASLTQEEVDALADFMFAEVVGVMPITRAACAVFFRGNLDSPACTRYPL